MSRKLSQVESFGPLHPPAVASVKGPVHVTDGFVPETVPAPGFAAFELASGNARSVPPAAIRRKSLSTRLRVLASWIFIVPPRYR